MHSTWLYVDKERCIARHDADVGIAFHTTHPSRISQCRVHVGRRTSFARCPFTTEYLGTIAVISVILEGIAIHLEGIAIIMLVNYVHNWVGYGVRLQGIISDSRNDLELWITSLNGLIEHLKSVGITATAVEEVLIAYLHVVKREGLGVTIARTNCSPFGGGVAHDIFYLVKRILNERLYVFAIQVVTVQDISCKDTHNRLSARVLSPLAELQQSQSIGRTIAPRTLVSRTLVGVAYGLLPVESVRKVVALQIVASRESQELRLHLSHHLHEVDTQTILPALEAGSKQGYSRQLDASRLVGNDE